MEIALTKMSSKGQVVIPSELREDLKEGDKLVIIKVGDQLIMKKASSLEKNFEEDVKFAQRSEEALKRLKSAKSSRIKFDDFIKEMKKW